MTTQEIISKNIVNLRKEQKLTQSELADKLNYTEQAISKWERGLSLPDPVTLLSVAQIFEVPIEYMYQDHTYALLSSEDEKKLKKTEIRIKITFIVSVFLLILIIAATMVGNYLKEMGLENERLFILILPGVLAIVCVINNFYGKKKYTLLFSSITIWSAANALFIAFYEFKHIGLIFLITIILQAAVIIFPLIDKHFIKIKEQKKSTLK